MAIFCKYDSDKAMLYCTAEGRVSIEDFQQAMLNIINSEEFSSDVRTLWDIRKMDLSSIDKEFALQLISLRKKNPQRGSSKMVIIAEGDYSFGMSRMYRMLSSDLPQKIMVFRDFEEGEKWLMK